MYILKRRCPFQIKGCTCIWIRFYRILTMTGIYKYKVFLLNQKWILIFRISISIFTNISKYVSSREVSFTNLYMHVHVFDLCGIYEGGDMGMYMYICRISLQSHTQWAHNINMMIVFWQLSSSKLYVTHLIIYLVLNET